MQYRSWICSIPAIVLLLLSGCGGGGSDSPQAINQRGDLISSTARSSYTQAALLSIATTAGLFPVNDVNMIYDAETFKLTYWTEDTDGNAVQASGLIAVPQKPVGTTTPILSFQHGTIFHNDEAPSNYNNYAITGSMLASMDFIVILPDYLGYGDSGSLLHTYFHAEGLSTATIDMIRATNQWLADNNIATNNQLFLGGYSEGGYATLATHKAIQQQYASEFSVTASAPGAGSYDLSNTAYIILNSTTLPFSPYVAFTFKAYDDIYGYNRIDEIFQPAYVDAVNNDFYGDYYAYQIEADLTNVTADLFDATFLSNYLGAGETTIKADLMANDIYDWTPTSPVRFYHGQDDVVVPYTNATTALATMTGNGATDITLIDCPVMPATHGNCSDPYLDDMAGYFLTF